MIGEGVVKRIDFLKSITGVIRSHHEHFDGRGYPDGKKGDEIPLGARILAVADAYDAMTSDRPYRSALSHEEAICRLQDDSDRQFDEKVVQAFLAVIRRKELS